MSRERSQAAAQAQHVLDPSDEEPIRLFRVEPKIMGLYMTPLSHWMETMLAMRSLQLAMRQSLKDLTAGGYMAGCSKSFLEERSGGGPHCLHFVL